MNKIVMVLALGMAVGSTALAKKNCTEEPKEIWMKFEDFKKKIE